MRDILGKRSCELSKEKSETNKELELSSFKKIKHEQFEMIIIPQKQNYDEISMNKFNHNFLKEKLELLNDKVKKEVILK